MKVLTFSILLCCSFLCNGQQKKYKDYEVCTTTELHKGKLNHNKPYCVGWITVREFNDGKKDTIGWYGGGGQIFIGDEYDKYNKLTERGRYIVDSLKEDGIAYLQSDYLTYESIYMKESKKVEQLWSIREQDIVVFEYLFWRNKSSNGFQLIKEHTVK